MTNFELSFVRGVRCSSKVLAEVKIVRSNMSYSDYTIKDVDGFISVYLVLREFTLQTKPHNV